MANEKENWEWTDISKLKTDGNNPNHMTNQEKAALRKNMERYGWNMPIITDLNYIVADGEQKLTVAKDMGLTEVPVLKKELSDSDRRLLRQSMNKLRGSHDEDLDAEEFKRILQDMEMQEFAELSSISEQEILNAINKQDKDDKEISKIDNVDKIGSIMITCPKCGHEFKKRDINE